MDSLPLELLLQILSQLPPSSSKHARLTCHKFNHALAKHTFATLASFLDPDVALSTLQDMAADLRRRPRAIWSPSCSVPKGLPVPTSFLVAVCVAVRGTSAPMACEGDAEEGAVVPSSGESRDESAGAESITACGFGRRIGREDITEEVLRQALFRYALYLSYVYEGQGEAPQLWVLNPKHWVGRA
ncbi:hypothetical protein PT974_11193 [Cladobotryum mycophilum]|uniref:F-box domain-containing protein n=1 Tax=Cladobotryum mycophilum TaxID=491253 RepID=A0ABR0S5M7_9HYPO